MWFDNDWHIYRRHLVDKSNISSSFEIISTKWMHLFNSLINGYQMVYTCLWKMVTHWCARYSLLSTWSVVVAGATYEEDQGRNVTFINSFEEKIVVYAFYDREIRKVTVFFLSSCTSYWFFGVNVWQRIWRLIFILMIKMKLLTWTRLWTAKLGSSLDSGWTVQ